MIFEWDEVKRLRVLADRGIDFEDILDAFDDPFRLERHDRRQDYGETRYVMLAMSSGRVYNIVYTVRNAKIRIITAFKANTREQSRYAEDR
jgi:uncharacterized DUF497 family protein